MLILRRQNQLFCNAEITNVRSKTPFTGVLLHASLEKKTISLSMHCSIVRADCSSSSMEPEIAFIWRHLIRGYMWYIAFMLPPESAFCSNHDRKRTLFVSSVHCFIFAEVQNQRFWNSLISGNFRSKTWLHGSNCSCFPRARRRFREHALRIVRAQVNWLINKTFCL